MIRLLLSGIAVSMVLGAMTNFMLMISKEQGGVQAVMFWMLGSLGGKVVQYRNTFYYFLYCISVIATELPSTERTVAW